MTRIRWVGNAVFVLTVAACGGPDLSDLERMVDEATQPSPRAEREPTADRDTDFEYGAMSERSPFEPFKEVPGAFASEAPDPMRRSQTLERFPLGQLEMVGTLAGRGRILALIRDPRRITHPVAVGDYVGRDHGRIAKVRASGIDILEHVEDGRGAWTVRARALELTVRDIPENAPAAPDNSGSES
ncbi:MAG: pilus assembly protein PilP [Gammaproteobacteria bacterium]|nr:pilus assembly protein PilP [Gammaproteobacteria bacterium]MXY55389.1 pilus assembly protein PilP [Gammaproteobacteria bacterium]MYF28143.1 pilus assembly protein PilP [Gammaproteobacteria bacterium]MYK47244.1 pilus assembly protein PilP [Gammaproteobacteria bacterium]